LLKVKFLHDEVELRNQLISGMLHRYVNRHVIEQILANPKKYSELGGDRKEVAAFFCDIRGFTGLSESMKAGELIRLLNSIYKELTGIVSKNKGTFDKYMGDCIMAFWGAPVTIENETYWALRAAMEMQKAFEELKQNWPPELKKLGIGIGINYGEVVAGNIGTEEAMDYTVIGDVVNTAQRVESIARHGQVLITKSALSRVEGKCEFRALKPVQLKGKSLPIEIYEVLTVRHSQ
jgi:adenylate cyclase